MNSNTIQTAKIDARPCAQGIADWCENRLLRPTGVVGVWKQRVRRRKELRRLLETGRHLVVDTGMGVDEALFEISKPFYVE